MDVFGDEFVLYVEDVLSHDICVDDAREAGRDSFDVPLDRPALPRGFLFSALCVHRPTSSVQSRLSSSLLGGVYAVGESVIVGETVDITAVGAGVSSAHAPAWSPRRAATTNNRL